MTAKTVVSEMVAPEKGDVEDGIVIGLEVHCQLTNLRTKLFCGCSADYRGEEPNTHLCPVCLGMPGTLPVVNRRAVDDAVMVALALNSEFSFRSLSIFSKIAFAAVT